MKVYPVEDYDAGLVKVFDSMEKARDFVWSEYIKKVFPDIVKYAFREDPTYDGTEFHLNPEFISSKIITDVQADFALLKEEGHIDDCFHIYELDVE